MPEFGQALPARAAPADRTGVVAQFLAFDADLAPAGFTVRISYTVPTDKKAQLSSAFAGILRTTAATTSGYARTQIQLVNVGVTATPPIAAAQLSSNTVGTTENVPVGGLVTLLAGEVGRGTTQDASTGGTVQHVLGANLTEYDA